MKNSIRRKISICTARVTTVGGDVYALNVPAEDAVNAAREAMLDIHEVYGDDITEIAITENRDRVMYLPIWKFVAFGWCKEEEN